IYYYTYTQVAGNTCLFVCVCTDDNMEDNHTFLYFAYGSNLLKERLQLKNPSATVHCVARLKDYKLVFGNHKGLASDRWHGGVATIEHSPGDEVWGVVWRMNVSDLESLDSQENVTLGAYSPVELSVKTKGQDLNCRTYIMNSCVYAPPSPQYLKVRSEKNIFEITESNFRKKLFNIILMHFLSLMSVNPTKILTSKKQKLFFIFYLFTCLETKMLKLTEIFKTKFKKAK
uniref:Gamma-glutamylcyclotransferase b n=1 Tax=Oreochromis niloticus TaxID=8128 RepID=A0A669BF88_ORENI